MKIDITKTGKQYQIIYADPGWKYGSGGPRSGRYKKLDYTTMTVEKLKELPVADISATPSVLLMWSTGSHIGNAIEVGTAWGFRFVRIDKVWHKTTKNGKRHVVPGPWGVVDAEHLLLFTKGKATELQKIRNQATVYRVSYTGKHSEKPHFFRNQIEGRFTGNKIELFARECFYGWDCWGDEV